MGAHNNVASELTHDAADDLYFERRDQNDSHERAVDFVRRNNAPESWEPPHASDYQGLPDYEHTSSPRARSPIYENSSNAAANHPAIAAARRREELPTRMDPAPTSTNPKVHYSFDKGNARRPPRHMWKVNFYKHNEENQLVRSTKNFFFPDPAGCDSARTKAEEFASTARLSKD